MGTKRAVKAAALTEVNRAMRQLALEDLPDEPWEFFCECGEPDCEQRVSLSIDAYDHLQEQHRAVIARAHRQIERAVRLGEDAQALANQAQQQIKRAADNQRTADRSPAAGSSG